MHVLKQDSGSRKQIIWQRKEGLPWKNRVFVGLDLCRLKNRKMKKRYIMSQLELSRRTGIATSNISDWKKKKTNPKADCLLSICDALDITPEQLLTGKGIDPEYKDTDMDYEVTRSDIKILKQIHSLGDEQYKRLMAYMKALQKLEQMESIVEE